MPFLLNLNNAFSAEISNLLNYSALPLLVYL
ncbi:hypothetical protein F383_33954 [Gossypium arboreum]|uniref:Uncharacterized protein n=1 Tax=Gossypium arboreum TaxID=29729 RepID=A0A0B0PWC1_GOSAR|nr:hypothetical protein F383_04307 [Gossypium arboreum]KHG27711.1 hypothetical protein F383_33954 [Gossypium arboreum]